MSSREMMGPFVEIIHQDNGKTKVHDPIVKCLDKVIEYNDRVIDYLEKEYQNAKARADDLEVDAYVTGNRPKVMRALEEAKTVQSGIMDALQDAKTVQTEIQDAKIFRLKVVLTHLGIPYDEEI